MHESIMLLKQLIEGNLSDGFPPVAEGAELGAVEGSTLL